MAIFLIVLSLLMIVVYLKFWQKRQKALIDKVTEVTVVKKNIVKESNQPHLIPSMNKEGLSKAGTNLSEEFFVASNSKKKESLKFMVTVKATLENGRVIEEDLSVSKKVYAQIDLNTTYPLSVFKG